MEMQSEAGAAGAVHGSLAGRCADHHLHRFPGPAADDPQYVQNCRRAAALRNSTYLPAAVAHPCTDHFRRSFRRICLPPDRFCHALLAAPRRRLWIWALWRTCPLLRAACLSCISSTVSVLPMRSRRSRCWDYEDLRDMLDMDAVEAFRNRALNPNHPVSAWYRSEPGHLLPGS